MHHKTLPANRRKLMALAALVALVTGLLLLSSAGGVWAQPTSHWVNDDDPNGVNYEPPGTSCDDPGYSTIQAAVDAASPGDIINVCPGTYNENVLIETDNLTVVSTSGASVTTVNAAVSGFVFWIIANGVTLDGFTIEPAGSGDPDIGVLGAWEGNSGNAIVRNVVTGGRIGIALHCTSFGNTIAYNTVTVPTVGFDLAAINLDTCEGSEFGSDNNAVHHNTACGGSFPYSIAAGGKSNNNTIHHNTAQWISVGGTGNAVHHNRAWAFDIAPGNTAHHNTNDPNVCP